MPWRTASRYTFVIGTGAEENCVDGEHRPAGESAGPVWFCGLVRTTTAAFSSTAVRG
jgi:hypothetical protein